jgi:hypothetical protein
MVSPRRLRTTKTVNYSDLARGTVQPSSEPTSPSHTDDGDDDEDANDVPVESPRRISQREADKIAAEKAKRVRGHKRERERERELE